MYVPPMTSTKIGILLLAGTVAGITAGIPVFQSMMQAGSLGFAISLGFVLGELECRKKKVTNKGTGIRTKWLVITGTVWGAIIGQLTSMGILSFKYGVISESFELPYPRNNTFGLLVEGVEPQVLPTIITGIFIAVAMGLAFGLLKEEDKMWFVIPWCVPLGWWTGAESLAIGQSLGYLEWEFIGPAQTQGMRFGIPWMEFMIISRWAYLKFTGDLTRLRAEIKAVDDAKWAAADAGSQTSG
ncbi:MAG: hypothetical protein ACE5FN_06280 [Leptospirillia bacterium]